MRNLFIFLFIVFLSSMSYAAFKSFKGPKIVKQEKWSPSDCHSDDPLGCNGEHVVIENLELYTYKVNIQCGGDREFDEQSVDVFPRTKQDVFIEISLPTNHPACRIESFQLVK